MLSYVTYLWSSNLKLKHFSKNLPKLFFFVISYYEFCFDFLKVEKFDLLSNKQPILASLELSINY